jgi:hypothetical protein
MQERSIPVGTRFRGLSMNEFIHLAMTKPKLSPNTKVVHVQTHDKVADLLKKIASGRVKSGQLSKEIEGFELEELERLSDELVAYYARKFR